jgi:hypothetical protein
MFELSWLLITIGGLFAGSNQGHDGCPKAGRRPGGFSQLSIELCFQDEESQRRHLEIPSPDRSLLLVVDGQEAHAYAKGREVGRSFTVTRDEEIVWSGDSRALLFTISFGAAGPVSADFGAVQGVPSMGDAAVTETIRRDFAARHTSDKCNKEVNVGGLTWLDGSTKAVLIAEVPPSPQCDDSGGYFEGYVVSFPDGQIVERCSMRETIRRWHNLLGPRLKGDIDLLKDR